MTELQDRDAPLEEHLRELRDRLVKVLIGVGALSLGVVFFAGRNIITFLKEAYVPPEVPLNALSPMEYVYSWMLVSVYVGLALGFPLIVYETFKFASPGLYPNERKLFLRVVPLSALLFFLGGLFSALVLIPLSMHFLIPQAEAIAEPFLNLFRVIKFVVFMLFAVGLLFEVPLLMGFMIKSEVVSKRELREKRKFIYPLFIGVGIFFTPDPTPVTPLLITLLLLLMFEVSLLASERLL